MPYHYEIRLPKERNDGTPDGVEIEIETACFPAMIDAINFARCFQDQGAALFMVLEDKENPALDDEVELPINGV
jgi:hypothetical protein